MRAPQILSFKLNSGFKECFAAPFSCSFLLGSIAVRAQNRARAKHRSSCFNSKGRKHGIGQTHIQVVAGWVVSWDGLASWHPATAGRHSVGGTPGPSGGPRCVVQKTTIPHRGHSPRCLQGAGGPYPTSGSGSGTG